METRASYVLVGAFVLALIAVAFGFVIWLARVEFEAAPQRYLVYFKGSVTGLAIGSPVRYRGVPVGSVAGIRIDPRNVERIEVALDVARGTPIKEDTVATLGLQGITGVAYILLSGGTQGSPALTRKADQAFAVIPSRPSGLEQVLARAPELFEQAVVLAERMARLVDDRNLKSVAETLDNFRKLSETLASRTRKLDRMLDDGREAMTSLRNTSENFDALSADLRKRTGPLAKSAKDVLADFRVTLSDVRAAANSFDEVSKRLDGLVEENRVPMRDFSTGGLYELSQFIAEARVLVAGLTRLSAQIERDPARFFFGDTQKGFEAK